MTVLEEKNEMRKAGVTAFFSLKRENKRRYENVKRQMVKMNTNHTRQNHLWCSPL